MEESNHVTSEDANIVKKMTLDHSKENWKVSMTKVHHGPSQFIIQHIDQYNSF
jgi:hypothetical protein